MRLGPAVLASGWLALAAGTLGADQYFYPSSDAPLFSVTIPHDWKVDTEAALLHATPPDESVYLGFWAVDYADHDAAAQAVGQIVGELVSDFSITSEDEIAVNGVAFAYFEGSGRSADDGTPLNAGVAIFSTDGETFCVMLFFGAPDAERRHRAELDRILESIRRPE